MSLLRLLTTGKSLVGMREGNSPYRMCTQNLVPNFGAKRNPFLPAPKGDAPAEPAPVKVAGTETLPLFDADPSPRVRPTATGELPGSTSQTEAGDLLEEPGVPYLSPSEAERAVRGRVSGNHGLVKPAVLEAPSLPGAGKIAPPAVEIARPGPPPSAAVEARPAVPGNPFQAPWAAKVEKSVPAQKYPVRRPLPRRPIKASGFTRWLAKMNPVLQIQAWGKVGSGVAARPKAPEQAELLLAQVKPLRNELTESDLQVVRTTVSGGGAKTQPPAGEKVMHGMTGPWNRLTKIFGADHVQAG